jgi:hypothetical protein
MRSIEFADGVERAVRAADQTVESRTRGGHVPACIVDPPREDRLRRPQFERQALILLLQAMNAGRGLQRQQQLFRLPGLEEILVNAGFIDAGDDVLGVGVTGEDDAQGVRPLAAHPPQELDAARLRHALVADDDLYPLAFHDALRLFGVRRGQDLEVLVERTPQRFAGAQLVVDDEHGRQALFRVAGHCATLQPGSRWIARWRGVQECGVLCTKW